MSPVLFALTREKDGQGDRRTRRQGDSSVSVGISALVICWLGLIAEIGAEQTRSDWAIATPSTIVSAPIPADIERQRLLKSILQMHVPPLSRPLTSDGFFNQAEASTSDQRYAMRSDGADGWRPAIQPAIPPGGLQQPAVVVRGSAELAEVGSPDSGIRREEVAWPGERATMERSELEAKRPASGPAMPSIEVKLHPARLGTPIEPLGGADSPSTSTSRTSLPAHDSTKLPRLGPTASDTAPSPLTSDVASESSDGDAPAEPPTATPPAQEPLPPLTRQLTNLRSRVRSVLKGYYRKQLNSRDHDPWEMMHGMLAYGVQSRMRQGGPRGEMVTSVGWLCHNKPCKGQTLMHVTREGQLRAKYGVGLQGHLGQLLAMLAQCRVSPAYPIRVGKNEFTIYDLIEAEKKTCYPKSELTFKLIALQYYLDLNDKWVNDQGVEWDFPRLVREELAQPIRGAACGGTHRLSGLSLTVKRRMLRGEPLDGEYARAAEFVNKYHQYAFRLQNRDGSLSTAWFQGRGDERDIDRRIKTTGHILEWLCYSLSDEELRDQRTIRAVSYLANLMYSNYNHEWEVGPVSHATHALLLYDERVFEPYDQPEYAVSYRPKRAAEARGQSSSRR